VTPRRERAWVVPASGLTSAITALRIAGVEMDHLFVKWAPYCFCKQGYAFGHHSDPPLVARLIGVVTEGVRGGQWGLSIFLVPVAVGTVLRRAIWTRESFGVARRGCW